MMEDQRVRLHNIALWELDARTAPQRIPAVSIPSDLTCMKLNQNKLLLAQDPNLKPLFYEDPLRLQFRSLIRRESDIGAI